MPQVHLDLHEQGFNDNYFTMPGTTPRNHELPENYEKWADVFGRGAIEEFDEHNINFATREAFDFFYPGYGSSYPSNMGAIGMLAEQGGHSRGGRAVETDDGYVLTLRQRIFDHYTNSIATVQNGHLKIGSRYLAISIMLFLMMREKEMPKPLFCRITAAITPMSLSISCCSTE
ncbi:MAG: hypothetical protein U5J63_09985 [Fodinibius sp.]|nr:hypothetical protein [Fodinibius sp.]